MIQNSKTKSLTFLKIGYLIEKNFGHKLSYTQKIAILMPFIFNDFLVPWGVFEQTENIARLEIMEWNFFWKFQVNLM